MSEKISSIDKSDTCGCCSAVTIGTMERGESSVRIFRGVKNATLVVEAGKT
jgi:hypothetical protein